MVRKSGFTLMEMMAVLAVIGILAAITIPSYLNKVVAEQVTQGIELAAIAKEPIGLTWRQLQAFPVDNADANLPVPEKIVNNYVQSIHVDHGVIHIVFGNNVNRMLMGKNLTLRPAVVEGEPLVPIAWICANSKIPKNMKVIGVDQTTVPEQYLPVFCRVK